MTLPAADHVLPPGIRTFKPRRSRITERQTAALSEYARWILPNTGEPLDFTAVWGPGMPVILEIGSGTGEATASMAAAEPGTGILAIDVHTPGVGNLLDLAGRGGCTNVRVMETDALSVLHRMIPESSLAGVRSFFPDPWPKSRHHKRRLVQPRVLELVADRVRTGAVWHLATDWAAYADAILECFAESPRWTGGVIERPAWRPVTRYERRALREGRAIMDLQFHTRPTDRITT